MKPLLVLRDGKEIAVIEIKSSGEYTVQPLSSKYSDLAKDFKEKVRVARESLGLPPDKVTEEEISQKIFRFSVPDGSYLVGNLFEY